ncbi:MULTISPECIES: acyltransferase family protein [Priestia]|uniref:acyltransferase family protein n=1 Tax=Priestia TaxID=2800373 RepID=UPI001C8EF894|nr:acyltransferase family protein [Priestia aryabhattai]MBY0214409.1 acyltransferase family protein [Priestia aryabhattai]MDT0148423.1 acyltransferase family protein [Priestia aryabhattai]MDT0153711.1 acyltransferase family protein [Priestia aryabhattai]
MNKSITYEIYWLRFISCLAVVGIHSISSGFVQVSGDNLGSIEYLLYVAQMGLMFGTPAFIFISEFLLAKSYKNGLPKGFLFKRVKFLLIPYIVMAILYAFIFVEEPNARSILIHSFRNIFLGDFVAYFVLIVFQFYILHMILHKNLKQWNPKVVLLTTLLINILFLGFFNFVPSPDNDLLGYLWRRGHWLIFISWLFYFSLGYYCGIYYEKIAKNLSKYKFLLFSLPPILLVAVVILRYLGLPSITSSKRVDIIFYTTSIIFLTLFIASKIKHTPKFVLLINKYSFSIYLLHKLVIDTVGPLSNSVLIHVVLTFIIGLVFSIITAYLINLLPFGEFIVGRPGKIPKDTVNSNYAKVSNL